MPGPLVFASILYAKMLAIPLVVSYHTHIPDYIPRYTWSGLVQPMWSLIRFASRMADLTLVTSKVMKVRTQPLTTRICLTRVIAVGFRLGLYDAAFILAACTAKHQCGPLIAVHCTIGSCLSVAIITLHG